MCALAVHVPPPVLKPRGALAVDLPAVDPRQVGLDGLGHEGGHRGAGAPQLVVVVGGLVGLVAAGGPPGLRRVVRVEGGGILPLVADQVPDRHAVDVEAVDGHAVGLAPLPRVEEPAPAELMQEPFGMRLVQRPAVGQLQAGHAGLARQVGQGRRVG